MKNSESVALRRYKIDTYNLADLDKVLNDVYCSCRPVSADYDARNDTLKHLDALALDIFYGKHLHCLKALFNYIKKHTHIICFLFGLRF